MARTTSLLSAFFVFGLVLLPTGCLSFDKVKVDFYGEALCPYCVRFNTKMVNKMFENKVADLMTFTYVPWGNARLNETSKEITCQHGPRECVLNTLISCVVDILPDQGHWFPVVECIEESAFKPDNVMSVLEQCTVNYSAAVDTIKKCFDGERGKELQLAAFKKTQSLVPAHRWVPWVTVNGIPLYDDYENIQAFVCAAYTGDDRPEVCFQPAPEHTYTAYTSLEQAGDSTDDYSEYLDGFEGTNQFEDGDDGDDDGDGNDDDDNDGSVIVRSTGVDKGYTKYIRAQAVV